MNHLPISAYSGVLNFDMKIFVTVARLEIGQLFSQGARRGHPYTLDTFLVFFYVAFIFILTVPRRGTSVVVPYCYLFLLSVFVLWFSYYVSDIHVFCKF